MLAYSIVAVALLLAILSFRGTITQTRYIRRRLDQRLADSECPPATVIVPVKGHDEHLAANLASLASLDYPDYELIITARAPEDIPSGVVPGRARTVIAGAGEPSTSEKISNLLAAVDAARPQSEILAFADSDNQVSPGWLRALAAPLSEPGVGASTGYRWHLPDPPDFWSNLRSVWNSVIAGGYRQGDNAFCWGGAMALRRDTFAQVRVRDYWRRQVSDDFQLSRAIHDAKLRIAYAPGALAADLSHTTPGVLLSWITRQMIVTRVYHPKLWWPGLVSHLIYCVSMIISLVQLPVLFLLLLVLGMCRGAQRRWAAQLSLPRHQEWFRNNGWIYTLLVPLATWLWLYAFLASAFTSTIHWRGRAYHLRR